MSKSRLIGELRKKAIETLRESTETLEQAFRKRESGDLEEQRRLKSWRGQNAPSPRG